MHLLRNSLRSASRKDWGAIARDLKPVYTAPTEAAALERFVEFSEKWEARYPAIIKVMGQRLGRVVPFLNFDPQIRAVICTTNAIESLNARCAPRGALLYPRRSREEFGGIFLGPMAHLDAKARGDKSMPSGGGHREDVEGGPPRDPRDMAKAGLLESQSPEGKSDEPAGTTSETGVVLCIGMNRGLMQPPEDDSMPSEGIQGDEWGACVTLGRTTRTNVGSPTGREPYGDAVPVVVAGVTSCQGGRESRPQGEGAQVMRYPSDGR